MHLHHFCRSSHYLASHAQGTATGTLSLSIYIYVIYVYISICIYRFFGQVTISLPKLADPLAERVTTIPVVRAARMAGTEREGK